MISASVAVAQWKPVGAADDQAALVVERLGASVRDAESHGGEDAVAVLGDRDGELDEGFQAAASRAADEPVDQDRDFVVAEVGCADRQLFFLERVGRRALARRRP